MWKLILLTGFCHIVFGGVFRTYDSENDYIDEESGFVGVDPYDFRVKFYDMCNQSTAKARCIGSILSTESDVGSCLVTKNCSRGAAVEYTEDGYVFHIMGIHTSYMALGFSLDQAMGNDAVVSCQTDDPVTMKVSYNFGVENYRADSDDGMNMIAAARDNGDLYCKFYLDDALQFARYNWSTTDTDFYMLVVSGDLRGNGDIGYHNGYAYSDTKWHYDPVSSRH